MKFTTEIMKVDAPNFNGRIYPRETMEKAIQGFMAKPSRLGQIGMDGCQIDMSNASHNVENIQIDEDGHVTATIQILETPAGKIARQLLVQPNTDFRTAGFGNVDKNGVVSDFVLASVNLVEDGA